MELVKISGCVVNLALRPAGLTPKCKSHGSEDIQENLGFLSKDELFYFLSLFRKLILMQESLPKCCNFKSFL